MSNMNTTETGSVDVDVDVDVCTAHVHATGGWIGTPDPITYRGEVVR